MMGAGVRRTKRRSLVRVGGLLPVLVFAGLLAGCQPEAGGTVFVDDAFVNYNQTVAGTNSLLTARYKENTFVLRDEAGLTAGPGARRSTLTA
jgi:hypothetical protein